MLWSPTLGKKDESAPFAADAELRGESHQEIKSPAGFLSLYNNNYCVERQQKT